MLAAEELGQSGHGAVRTILGGSGDLVSRLIMGIIGVIICLIGAINLLTKSLDPPSSAIVDVIRSLAYPGVVSTVSAQRQLS